MLSSEELRHLQLCELKIAREVKRICDKFHIRYYITCGTLLGAVRHQGFIPWDDDIDFVMERSEYDRFCEVCLDELSSEYFLQTWDSDEEYPFSYAKLRLNGTKIVEKFVPEGLVHSGIFVDIFPLDNVPDAVVARKIQKYIYFFFCRLLWMKKGYGKCIKSEGVKQNIKYCLFSMLGRVVPFKWAKNKYESLIKRYNHEKTVYMVADSIYPFEKNMIHSEWIEKANEYVFEDTMLSSFADYDAFLTHIFGDYMKLPPEEKRHNHSISSIDFGEY